MVVAPSLSKDLTFIVNLSSKIITKLVQSILEFLLESVQSSMHILHGKLSLLLVLLNFAARKKEKW